MGGARSPHRRENEWKEIVRNLEEKRQLGRLRRKLKGIIKMDLIYME